MPADRKSSRLAKLLHYVLGCRPDEFGLVPDADGYVKIKTLLQAFSEEHGLAPLRRADLEELFVSGPQAVFEKDERRIRALERTRLPRPEVCDRWPERMFVGIRRRAHGRVLEHGIAEPEPPGLIMTPDTDMALRIGRRRDPEPVLLTVRPRALVEAGVSVHCYGHLFLATALPPGTFTAPPLPKEKPRAPKPPPPTPAIEPHPGSFHLKPEPDRSRRPRRGKNEDPEWKRARREKRGPRDGKKRTENFDFQY